MEKNTITKTVLLYKKGLSIREISLLVPYSREKIRLILKNEKLPMRYRNIKYNGVESFSHLELIRFAELFGYFFGDGYVSDNRYDCTLSFSLDETDLVRTMIMISEELFSFAPVVVHDKGFYRIIFKRTFGRYLIGEGYPPGKKSKINPNVPNWIVNGNDAIKAAFIRGFFNAESTINKGILVHQSAKFKMPLNIVDGLKLSSKIVKGTTYDYHYVRWKDAQEILPGFDGQSNILNDIRLMLNELGIETNLYPIRLMINPKNEVSVHFQLYVLGRSKERFLNLKLITCKKKLRRMNICRGDGARSIVQELNT